MKKRVYLRVAKNQSGLSVRLESIPNYHPIRVKRDFLPTVLIALELDIPDKEFDVARILLEAKIEETNPAVKIEQVNKEDLEETSWEF